MSETLKVKNDLVLPHRWAALAVLASAVSLIVIDGTIVNVSLPVIIRSLSLDAAQAAWVTSLYNLIFSALLITTGRLADQWGRRRMLVAGIGVFIVGSVVAAATSTGMVLLIARAIQGIGGAMVLPCTLSTVNATFFGHDRRIAFGVWGSTISGMAAFGPLLGGFLTTHASWRWIFLVNIPLGVAIVVAALLVVPDTRDQHGSQGFDVPGFLLSVLGMGGLVFGLIQGPSYGWIHGIGNFASWQMSPALLALIAGALSMVIFFLVEHSRGTRGTTVLLDVTMFRFLSFKWGNVAAFVVAMGEFGMLFVLPLYLQNVLGLSALGSGWVLATMAIGAFLAGGSAAHLATRLGAARVATLGLGLETVGLILVALVLQSTTPAWAMALVLVVYGIGLGLASAQLTSVVLHQVPAAESGQGSAVQSTVRQVGSAVGVAVIATLLSVTLNHQAQGAFDDIEGLTPAVAHGIERSIAPSLGSINQTLRTPQPGSETAQIPAAVRAEVVEKVSHVMTAGSKDAMVASALIVAIGCGATLKLRRMDHTGGHGTTV